jgi:hypothetical protein
MMPQLLLHLVGDYLTQSDWMAQNKRSQWLPAIAHASLYSAPFAFFGSAWALAAILASHLLIDHYGLARYVVFAKNFLAPTSKRPRWEHCKHTGYDQSRPVWMSMWLLIIADNTIHLCCNYAALRWL